MKTLESKIKDVTVFTDRAQITREAKIELDKGHQTLIFDNLPRDIDKNSIQADGKGHAILRDIKFMSVQYSESPDLDINKLQKEREKLNDDIVDIDDIINHAHSEKAFLDNIVTRLTFASQHAEKNIMPDPDPEKWVKMVDFYREKIDSIDKEIRTQEREKREITKELDKIERELRDSGNKDYKTKYQVEVKVEMKEEGELVLDLSYIVYGPTWYPVYDIRVYSKLKNLKLEYNAMIKQATGEDWENTNISLSTARPAIGGQQPELLPWRIDIYHPDDFTVRQKEVMYEKKAPNKVLRPMVSEVAYPEENIKEEAVVVDGMTSVVFSINDKVSVPGDNHPHKLSVKRTELPAKFHYSSVPKLSQYAYLKVKAKNNTDFPFLSGSTNVFLDGSFVSNSHLEFVSPGEKFWTSLGVDEGINIEYQLIKKYYEDEGVFTKKTKINNEYLITIQNNKKTEEEIVIYDQLPISENADINVNLVTPEIKKDTKNPVINNLKFLEWKYTIKPGEKIEIPFEYIIDYPKDVKITGI